MIPRYEHECITALWSDQFKFECFLKVELAHLKNLEGNIAPAGIVEHIQSKAKIDPDRILEIEKTTRHDVIAFCTSITEQLDEKFQKYFHYGLTSSDVIDTALSLQIKASMDLIEEKLIQTISTLKNKIEEVKDIIALGRSHGISAEPFSFAHKFLSAMMEFNRRLVDYQDFKANQLTGQLSGSIGNYALIDVDQEQKAIESLGLKVESLSTQIIPRDRIAKLVSIHALIASAIERVSTEVRLLHHSDINEVFEGFSKGQKGSSTMPHKKNPISTENLSGIARVLKSHISIALENNNLWHERDISHSSAERMMLPDSFGLLYYGLNRLNSTIENLVINKENIEQKVENNFNYLSSFILHQLIGQLDTNRETLYEIVQKSVFESQSAQEFLEKIESDCEQKNLGQINFKNFDLKETYLDYFEKVYKRCLKEISL